MPNTKPVTDNGVVVEYIKSVAAAKGHCRVYPSGAMTKGLKGEIISEMGDMVEHGCVPSPMTAMASRAPACCAAPWITARCSAKSS